VNRLEPGQSARFQFGPTSARIVAWYTVLGHREQGMEIVIDTQADTQNPTG